jgi:mannitol-1-phosphate 5-dehydrogenase
VLRKLTVNDRLVGAANLALEYDIIPENICTGIAAALHYNYKKDVQASELQKKIEIKGVDAVLSEVSGIERNSKLSEMIKTKYLKLKDSLKILIK